MRKLFVLTVFCGGLGAALGAHAQDQSGFYLGGSIGEATNQSYEFKGRDTAFKLSGGYAFNRYLGIEVAFVDAGTQDDTIGPFEIETESSGFIASAVVRLPIGDTVAMFSKAGYAFYDSRTTQRFGNTIARESGNYRDFAYGIGLEFAVWGGLKLRAEYEAVNVSDGDFDIVWLGVVYRF